MCVSESGRAVQFEFMSELSRGFTKRQDGDLLRPWRSHCNGRLFPMWHPNADLPPPRRATAATFFSGAAWQDGACAMTTPCDIAAGSLEFSGCCCPRCCQKKQKVDYFYSLPVHLHEHAQHAHCVKQKRQGFAIWQSIASRYTGATL